MNKKETLSNLRSAKSYLVQWKSHIQGFALGMPVDARHLPLIHIDSLYSKWFYSEAQGLKGLAGFAEIGPTIEECFTQFQKLHKLVQSEPQKAGLFASQAKADQNHKEEIEAQAGEVFNKIKTLIELTKQLEKAASKLSEEEFEALI